MEIKALQKTTLLDFPSKVACTVFTGGCNFRCPFCHNASLVLSPNEIPSYDTEDFFSYINKRKGILDGVCITGGEPLLNSDIIHFIERIKKTGLAVKLDTNGSMPEAIRSLVEAGVIDYIAMDIKNSRERYAETCGLPVFPKGVEQSVQYIMSCGVDYEFRTTLVKELHTVSDMENIGKWIAGAKRYFLQSYIDSGDILDNKNFSAHSKDELDVLLAAVLPFVPNAQIRGEA